MLTKVGSSLTPVGGFPPLPCSCDHENSMASPCTTSTASALPEECEGLYFTDVPPKVQAPEAKSRGKTAAEWIGLVTAVALLLGVLVGGIRYTVRQDLAAHSVSIDGLRSDIANLRSDITRIDGRITSTESKVDGLLSKALDKAFSKTSSGKIASRDAIETASQIIDVARSFEVKLSPETIRLTGNRLVSLSGKEQPIAADAWRVLQSTLGYASAITLPAPQWELTPPVPGNPTPFGDFEMEGVRQFFSARS